MTLTNRNSGKRWSRENIQELKKLADKNTPTRVIGIKIGRTPDAIYKKASEKGIGLDPTNQKPYGRKK